MSIQCNWVGPVCVGHRECINVSLEPARHYFKRVKRLNGRERQRETERELRGKKDRLREREKEKGDLTKKKKI